MKKLKLNLQNIEGAELLTREQLKTVMGGSGDGDDCDCNSKDDCSESQACYNCGSNGENGQKWGKCMAEGTGVGEMI